MIKFMEFLTSPKKEKPSVGPKMDGDYYIWDKGDIISLSPYFSSKEFTCHCHFPDCVKQKIHKDLIDKLSEIRKEIKRPLVITSAYRCFQHQSFLRSAGVNTVIAKNTSQHELGNAADAVPVDGNMKGFEDICAKHFTSIGLADNFLHLDLRAGHRRWNY